MKAFTNTSERGMDWLRRVLLLPSDARGRLWYCSCHLGACAIPERLLGLKNVDGYGKIVKEKLTLAFRWLYWDSFDYCYKDFKQALRIWGCPR